MNARRTSDGSARFSSCLVFAVMLHVLIILGISFNLPDPQQLLEDTGLEVILVQRASTKAPDEAAYLAQANQRGGGTKRNNLRPTAPLSTPLPALVEGVAHTPRSQSRPRPDTARAKAILHRVGEAVSLPVPHPESQRPLHPSDQAMAVAEQRVRTARLEAEIGEKLRAYAKRPKKTYLSANTREYRYARYMQAWVAQVERVGTLNFPPQATRQRLFGELVLSVGVRFDGSIDSVRIVRPSGHEILDRAALRIVRLAAPYDPLPEQIRDETDILQITRTWQFLPGSILRHR